MVWTSDDLVSAVRLRCRIPSSDAAFPSADILTMANEENLLHVVPLLQTLKQDYNVRSLDTSIVASQQAYRLPTRSLAGTVRSVVWVDTDGTEYTVDRIELENFPLWTGMSPRSGPYVYAIEGDRILLQPTPTTAVGTLRLRYFRRPSTLVAVSAGARITSIAAPNYTCSAGVPSTMTTSTPLDLIEDDPGFDLLLIDQTPSQVTSTVVSFTSSLTGPAVGNFFNLAGETSVVQVPEICHPLLVAAVSVRVHEALGDVQAMAASQAKLEQATQAVRDVVKVRDAGSTPKIIARNSPLRQPGRWRRR